MSVEAFLDTNILVYAAAGRRADAAKRARALALIEEGRFRDSRRRCCRSSTSRSCTRSRRP